VSLCGSVELAPRKNNEYPWGINPGRALYTPCTTPIIEHLQLQTLHLVHSEPL